MRYAEKALEYYCEGGGFNCAHSVLLAFAPEFGMKQDMARVAAVFGGGVARSGETCGAVTGALMVLGLKHGMIDAADQESKGKSYALAKELMARYKERRGTVMCKDLLGYDISTPEGMQAIKEQKLGAKLCTGIIQDAVELLEEYL